MINRETTPPEFEFLTSLFDKLIKGKTVYIPRELISVIKGASRESAGRDNVALVYHLIQSECDRRGKETTGIHSKRFNGITTDSETINKSKELLKNKGYLAVGSGYQVGKSPKAHTLLNNTDLVEYQLEVKSSHSTLYLEPLVDERCKQTRKNLNQVEVDIDQARKIFQMTVYNYLLFGIPGLRDKELTSGEKKHIKNGVNIENLPKRTVSNLHGLLTPLIQIIHKKGSVIRAEKGGRLFSPLTQLKKHFRNCLSVEGERLVSIDMVCCQPSLIACLSQDTRCLDDCVANRFYTKIAESLFVTREQAKETFCEYSFGPHRTEKTRAKNAFAIQNFIKDKYPRFYSYVKGNKKRDYRTFAARLQEVETKIFIEGALAEFQKQNIFALTIHDSVLVKFSDIQRAETTLKIIGDSILQKYIPKSEIKFEFKIESKVSWFPEENIIKNNLIDKFKELKNKRRQETSFMFMDSDSDFFNTNDLESGLYESFTHSITP